MGQVVAGQYGCFLVSKVSPMQQQIEKFEAEVLGKLQPAELLLEHLFSEGLYARKITIPAGVMATGRVHRFRALNVLLSGEISDMTPHGVVRHIGPKVWVGEPGVKRLLYAHTDVIWMTVHATEETDPATVKETLTSATYAEFLESDTRRLT